MPQKKKRIDKGDPKENISVSFKMERADLQRLDAESERQRRTRGNLIRIVVEDYLDDKDKEGAAEKD